jgi:hypothetical protein
MRLDGDAALALEVHRVEDALHRAPAAAVISRKRSADDLPWSMCAMTEKFRM